MFAFHACFFPIIILRKLNSFHACFFPIIILRKLNSMEIIERAKRAALQNILNISLLHVMYMPQCLHPHTTEFAGKMYKNMAKYEQTLPKSLHCQI